MRLANRATTPWRAASGQGDRLGGVLFNTRTAARLVKLGANPTLGKPVCADPLPGVPEMMHKLLLTCACAASRAPFRSQGFGPVHKGVSPATKRFVRRSRAGSAAPCTSTGGRRQVASCGEPRARARFDVLRVVSQTAAEGGNFVLDAAEADRISSSPETLEKVVEAALPSMPRRAAAGPITYVRQSVGMARASSIVPPLPTRTGPAGRTSSPQSCRVRQCGARSSRRAGRWHAHSYADEQAHGFDTNADALSVVPALLDRYLTARQKFPVLRRDSRCGRPSSDTRPSGIIRTNGPGYGRPTVSGKSFRWGRVGASRRVTISPSTASIC